MTSITRAQRHQMAVRQWETMVGEPSRSEVVVPGRERDRASLESLPESVQERFTIDMIDPLLDAAGIVVEAEEPESEEDRGFRILADQILVAGALEGDVVERISALLPWTRLLSDEARKTCVRDLRAKARLSLATNNPNVLREEYQSWNETTEAVAVGLGDKDVDWLDDEGAHGDDEKKETTAVIVISREQVEEAADSLWGLEEGSASDVVRQVFRSVGFELEGDDDQD